MRKVPFKVANSRMCDKWSQRHSSHSGFTLVELLIAMGIFAFLMSLAFSALTKIIETKKLLDDKRDNTSVVNAILSRMVRELQLADEKRSILPSRGNLSSLPPAKQSMLGEPHTDDKASADSITFLAREGGQYLPDGGTHSGLVQISYRLEKAPPEERSDLLYLVREEVPVIRPFDKAYKKAMIFPVSHNLVSLQFRYLPKDSTEWLPSWGTKQNLGLPALIKLSLTVRSPQGNENSYSTVVAMHGTQ